VTLTPNRLRIITYNIHRCIGADREISPERIANVIAVHHPDIVALQEVDCGQMRPTLYDQAAIIAEHLKFPDVWIERERCGNAILSRYPMTRIKAGGLHRLRRWHHLTRRGALWVEIEALGTRIQVINTHLGLTPSSRFNQAKILAGPEWLNSPACLHPVILCGDFNTQSGSTVFTLLEEKLRNVEKLKVNGESEKTWPSFHPFLNFDHMFISDDLSVEAIKVPTGSDTRTASDHLPFFAEFSLPHITPALAHVSTYKTATSALPVI